MGKGKGVSFVSKQTGITEFISVPHLIDKTFGDVAEVLYSRLLTKTKVIQQIQEQRDNLIKEDRRAGLIKFFYLSDEGESETPISKAMSVMEFYMHTGISEVFFFVDVIGGQGPMAKQSDTLPAAEDMSHLLFLNHAKAILDDPRQHGRWELKEYQANRFRLIKTLMDRYRRSITVVLQPSVGYPRRPPRVVTLPRHRDPCFDRNGELHWTVVVGDRRFTWELYQHHKNPLLYLLDELKTKYGLVF